MEVLASCEFSADLEDGEGTMMPTRANDIKGFSSIKLKRVLKVISSNLPPLLPPALAPSIQVSVAVASKVKQMLTLEILQRLKSYCHVSRTDETPSLFLPISSASGPENYHSSKWFNMTRLNLELDSQ